MKGAPVEPGQHARVTPSQGLAGQRLQLSGAVVHVAYIQAQVVQRQRPQAVYFVQGNVTQVARLVMDGQHLARHHFNLPHTHHVQRRVGDPGDDAQGAYLLGGLARQSPVVRGHVVDGDDRQFVLRLALAQLRQNPFAVSRWHRPVGFAARVPALKQ